MIPITHMLLMYGIYGIFAYIIGSTTALRLLGMSWGVKTTCLEAPGVSLGGSGVSIGGVGSLREVYSIHNLLGNFFHVESFGPLQTPGISRHGSRGGVLANS